jgi:hypothetical protein
VGRERRARPLAIPLRTSEWALAAGKRADNEHHTQLMVNEILTLDFVAFSV